MSKTSSWGIAMQLSKRKRWNAGACGVIRNQKSCSVIDAGIQVDPKRNAGILAHYVVMALSDRIDEYN